MHVVIKHNRVYCCPTVTWKWSQQRCNKNVSIRALFWIGQPFRASGIAPSLGKRRRLDGEDFIPRGLLPWQLNGFYIFGVLYFNLRISIDHGNLGMSFAVVAEGDWNSLLFSNDKPLNCVFDSCSMEYFQAPEKELAELLYVPSIV